MSYRLAKWLFPKMRPDQSLKRLNTIVFVTIVTVVGGGALILVMLAQYDRTGR